MPEPRNWKTNPSLGWGQWIAIYCTLAFLMFAVDDAINHYYVIRENALAWTPLLFLPPVTLYTAVSIGVAGWRRWAWVPGLLAVLVGGIGTVLHNFVNLTERGNHTIWQAIQHGERPILAPAAIAATGLLMLLYSWGSGGGGGKRAGYRTLIPATMSPVLFIQISLSGFFFVDMPSRPSLLGVPPSSLPSGPTLYRT